MGAKDVVKKTDSMRSRRQILAGAAGALGAIAAESVVRAPAAQAVQGSAIIAGQDNTETSATTITNTAGNALVAVAPNDWGVYGSTDTDVGVMGRASSADGTGTFGWSPGTGVQGFGSGIGVYGVCDKPTGAGILAWNAAGGAAVRVGGTAEFSRSGKAVVRAEHSSVVVTLSPGPPNPDPPLTRESLILATIQQSRGGFFVESAVPNASGTSFTVHLNKPVTRDTKVGWFIVN